MTPQRGAIKLLIWAGLCLIKFNVVVCNTVTVCPVQGKSWMSSEGKWHLCFRIIANLI